MKRIICSDTKNSAEEYFSKLPKNDDDARTRIELDWVNEEMPEELLKLPYYKVVDKYYSSLK